MDKIADPILRKLRNWFGLRHFSEEKDYERLRKSIFLHLIFNIGSFFLIIYSVLAALEGNYYLVAFDFATALLLSASALYFRRKGNFRFALYSGLALVSILYIYLVISGGEAKTGHLWIFTYPLIVMYLFGGRVGLLITIVFLALVHLTAFALDVRTVLDFYSDQYLYRLVGSFIVVFIIAYIYEYIRERTHRRFYDKRDKLERTVAELSKAESILRNSEQKFRNLIEHARDAILILRDGRIIFSNWAIEEITGYSAGEVHGMQFADFITEEDRYSLEYFMENFENDLPGAHIIESSVRHRLGYKINVELNINYIYYEQQPALQVFMRDITSRIQAMESLESSERKFRSLFEASGDAILLLKENNIIECNSRSLRLLGGSIEEIRNSEIFEYSPPMQPDRRKSRESMEELIALAHNNEDVNFEWQCRRKDGGLFYADIGITKLKTDGENLLQMIIRDVSYRKRTEEILHEQKALLDEVFQNVQEGIGIVDENETILFCNEAFARLFESPKEKLIGMNILSFFESEAREIINQQSRLRKSGRISTYEIPLRTDSGEHKFVRFNVSPRFSPEGHFAGGFAAVLDITALKQNERELEKYREHLERLVSERTAELNRSNKYLHSEIQERVAAEKKLSFRLRYEEGLASYSGSLLSGFEENLHEALYHLLNASQVSRVYLAENVEDPDKGLAMHIVHEVCASGVEPTVKSPDGLIIPYKFGFGRWEEILREGLPMLGHMESFPENERKILAGRKFKSLLILPIMANGKWYGFLGFEDVEKQREWNMEAPLLQTATDLMGSYIERRSYEQRLHQAKEEAEKISRLKSQFLANVSHEIRTPLNGIIGFSEVILSSKDIESIKNKTKSIISESESLLLLINDILDHAKIEAGKTVLEPNPMDIVSLMEELVSVFYVQAQTRGLDFAVTVEDSVPRYLFCDRLRLRQVLMNLLSNAFKFTKSGSVTIDVRSIRRMGDKVKLAFAVIDTGIGIPREQHENIFSSFSQADGSTTRKYGGTGLGTTISRQLVELMDGKMYLESEPGIGSKFWFEVTLPVSGPPIENPEEMDVNEDIQHVLAEERKANATKILVVDDYPPNREVARMHLEAAGHEVHLAEDGEKGLELCDKMKFDLILMDIQMPNMDGYEASERIRSQAKINKNIPIIALTANIEASAKVDCLHAGMNDVITKPIRRKSFLTTVDKWLFLSDSSVKSETLIEALPPESRMDEDENADSESGETIPQPIDLRVAVDEFGSIEVVRNVTLQFIDNVDRQLEKINESIENRDSETLRREFHSIKGGSATLEALPLAGFAKKLEDLSKNDKFEEINALMPEFYDSFEQLKHFFFENLDPKTGKE
ncbi:MAG: PAS domain S-box protein [Candidatus Kapaibacterium sp.]